MWPDRVSNPGPLTYKSGALPTALCHGPAKVHRTDLVNCSHSRSEGEETLSYSRINT